MDDPYKKIYDTKGCWSARHGQCALVHGGELVVIGGVRPWGTEADVKLEQRQKEVCMAQPQHLFWIYDLKLEEGGMVACATLGGRGTIQEKKEEQKT